MKNQNSEKRSLINVNIDHKFLWGILILLVVGLSYASTTISDSYINTTGQVNATEFYVNDGLGNSSKLTKPYDVVVCPTADSGCDIVCNATDCGTQLVNSVSSNKNTLWKAGTYNLPSSSGVKMLFTGLNNVRISAYGAILNATNSGHTTTYMKISSSNNVYVDGLTIIGNNTCATSSCEGIESNTNSNIFFENINIQNIKGFQIFINCANSTSSCNNTHVTNSYFKGVGVGDVIGGGVSQSNANMSNIYIEDNVVIQGTESGTYNAGIDLVGTDYLNVLHNMVYGDIVTGSETKDSSNSRIEGNILFPKSSSSTASIQSLRPNNILNVVRNKVTNGSISIIGNNSLISENEVYVESASAISINGSYNRIERNYVSGGNRGINLVGTVPNSYNSIKNNYIYRTAFQTNPISIIIGSQITHTTISSNEIYVPSGISIQNAIYLGTGSNRTIVDSNKLINDGTVTQRFVTVEAATTSNITIQNNIFQGNTVGSGLYNKAGGTQAYIDNFNYTSAPVCNPEHEYFTIFNTTTGANYTKCTCIGGSWLCGSLS